MRNGQEVLAEADAIRDLRFVGDLAHLEVPNREWKRIRKVKDQRNARIFWAMERGLITFGETRQLHYLASVLSRHAEKRAAAFHRAMAADIEEMKAKA